jgi:hypothetical protein
MTIADVEMTTHQRFHGNRFGSHEATQSPGGSCEGRQVADIRICRAACDRTRIAAVVPASLVGHGSACGCIPFVRPSISTEPSRFELVGGTVAANSKPPKHTIDSHVIG